MKGEGSFKANPGPKWLWVPSLAQKGKIKDSEWPSYRGREVGPFRKKTRALDKHGDIEE